MATKEPITINKIRIPRGEGQTHGKIHEAPITNFFSEEQRRSHAERIMKLPRARVRVLEGVARRLGYWKHVDWSLVRERLVEAV